MATQTTRDKIVTKCKIGGIEFVATAASGGQTRRIARYEAIGWDGAALEDYGEGPRVETIRGRLDEIIYSKLRNVQQAGKAVEIIHPLFDVFDGRIEQISYEADTKSLVNATIVVIEEGAPQIISVSALTLPQASAVYTGATNAFNEGIDDLPAGIPTALSSSITAAQGANDEFGTSLESVLDDDADFGVLGGLFDDLATEMNGVIEAMDDAVNAVYNETIGAVEELVDSTISDAAYAVINAAQDAVTAAQQETAVVWEPFTVIEELSVAELAIDWLGEDSDKNITLILESNPAIIDVNAVDSGFELLVPIQQ